MLSFELSQNQFQRRQDDDPHSGDSRQFRIQEKEKTSYKLSNYALDKSYKEQATYMSIYHRLIHS